MSPRKREIAEEAKVELAQLADVLELCSSAAIELENSASLAPMAASAFALGAREASRITATIERALAA
ncbi:hypothetical protein [Sphingomonas sp. BE137]|uniref:hypothetical protein n=1 Tax=Sphingomonas sp. BE137 TaxID=2817844 RepID=UPI001AE1CEC2|nr:hypothetical protein [Sphingomonas sp. BE137]MDR6850372.1 hypothetical protein [Sphingomonas sp. BE137]